MATGQRTQVTEAEGTSGGGEVREALGSGGTVEELWILLPMEREPIVPTEYTTEYIYRIMY